MTEQGTLHTMETATCMKFARYGPAYNPYLRPN